MKIFVMVSLACMTANAITIINLKPGWWKSVILAPTPTNDLVYAESVLRAQEDTVSLLDMPRFRAEDAVAATNLWQMLASLHGDLRSKRRDNLPTVYRTLGYINDPQERQSRFAENTEAIKLCNYEMSRRALEERIGRALENAAASEALASFSASGRNAIVSNLVETARFTPEEAASLGLTNIVETAGTRPD